MLSNTLYVTTDKIQNSFSNSEKHEHTQVVTIHNQISPHSNHVDPVNLQRLCRVVFLPMELIYSF